MKHVFVKSPDKNMQAKLYDDRLLWPAIVSNGPILARN